MAPRTIWRRDWIRGRAFLQLPLSRLGEEGNKLRWTLRTGGKVLKKLLHVGATGDDFERVVERFKGFGFESSQVLKDEDLPPKGDDPMVNVVTGQKGAISHLCFQVDNLEESIGNFERNGEKLVKGCPRQGAHGRVAFFNPETTEGVLVELCELGPDQTM
jgi:catechol 2,3-dioxygenase-like lactoylglutathione lyase family enzyme